jgi:hypothetical protein
MPRAAFAFTALSLLAAVSLTSGISRPTAPWPRCKLRLDGNGADCRPTACNCKCRSEADEYFHPLGRLFHETNLLLAIAAGGILPAWRRKQTSVSSITCRSAWGRQRQYTYSGRPLLRHTTPTSCFSGGREEESAACAYRKAWPSIEQPRDGHRAVISCRSWLCSGHTGAARNPCC